MTGLAEIFSELGISQYLQTFIDQGFDTWETILDIKESDFDALDVKLGHRRKLQRRIANARGISTDTALESPSQSAIDGPDDSRNGLTKGEGGREPGSNSGTTQGAKRKYRRHPKTDENAPERPPSAYVIFSNKMRDDLKGRNLSFTEIAKLVGENWQSLSVHDKEPFENEAAVKKEKYLGQLVEYKKTEQYREYAAYLLEFKAKQQNQTTGKQRNLTPLNFQIMLTPFKSDQDSVKRPKLESVQVSANSTGTTSSGTSYGQESTAFSRDGSVNSMPWPSKDVIPPQAGNTPHLSRTLVATKISDNTNPSMMGTLPGYRESIYGTSPTTPSWREETNLPQRMPPMSTYSDQRPSLLMNPRREPLPLLGSLQSTPGSQQSSHPPPLMTHESTNSNTSSVFPRTPLESPGDRTLPPIYPPKLPGQYEVSLPSIRPPSLSPQTSYAGQSHSPHGTLQNALYPQPEIHASNCKVSETMLT